MSMYYDDNELTQLSGSDNMTIECASGTQMIVKAGDGINGGTVSLQSGSGGASGGTGDITITAPDQGLYS